MFEDVDRNPPPQEPPITGVRGFLTLEGGDEMAKSAVSEVLKIQAQYEEARKAAISELLTQRKEIDDQLKALGHGGATKTPSKGAGAVGDKPCSVCGFKTNPPHDARAHRSQKKKEAFNKADLDEKGMAKA